MIYRKKPSIRSKHPPTQQKKSFSQGLPGIYSNDQYCSLYQYLPILIVLRVQWFHFYVYFCLLLLLPFPTPTHTRQKANNQINYDHYNATVYDLIIYGEFIIFRSYRKSDGGEGLNKAHSTKKIIP